MKGRSENVTVNGKSLHTYMSELISMYKSVGLFKQYSELNIEDFIEKMRGYIFEEFGFKLEKLYERTRLRRIIDVLILTYDTQRVWVRDTKEDVSVETKLYEKTLLQWSSISEGKFLPENVREIWDEEKDIIYLDMIEGGKYKRAELEPLPGILDVGSLIKQINELFEDAQHRFYVIGLSDVALVIMLTEEQKTQLQNERGLEFVMQEELDGYPPAKLSLYLKSFKRAFVKWRVFEFILFIIAALDFGYISYKLLSFTGTKLIEGFMKSGYVLSADKYYWIFVCIFIGIFFGGYSARSLLRAILNEKSEGYRVYLQMFCGEGGLNYRVLKVLSGVIGTAAAILIFLGMNWYVAFTDNEIIINPLWSLKQARYSYSDVQSVKKLERIRIEGKNTVSSSYIEISFKDGSSWTSNSEGRTPSPYFDEGVAEFIAEKSGKAVE